MIGQYGGDDNWNALYDEQINSIKTSGLYDNIEFIDLFVKGQSPVSLDKISDKVNNITYLGDLEEDRPTNRKLYRAYNQIMQRIWAFSAANPEYKILFFHSLGVSRDSEIGKRSAQFRMYFEKILIHNWKDCINALEHYDCAGVEYIPLATFRGGEIEFPAPHYQGFFWWANANYLNKLDPTYFNQNVQWQPYLCELWIGSGNPKAYSFYNTWRNRYYDDLGDVPYQEILEKSRKHFSELSKKRRIAFVMNSASKCGVYEYGKLTLQNLQKSNRYEYVLIEASSEEEFISKFDREYDGVIWNCGPFGWMMNCLSKIKQEDIPNFVITGHGSIYEFANIKQHFVCDPTIEQDGKIALERPLVKFENLDNNPPGNVIKIGSFGFGGWNKNFTGIVEAVNQQFSEPVMINFNISYADYFEYSIERGTSHVIAEKCRQLANPNVIINISHDYMNIEDTVRFLNSNDINLFLYHDVGPGISSCVDFALMAEKPLMVNRSKSFNNINWKEELLFDCNTIKEVIERGLEPTNEFRSKWSTDNIIKTFEIEFGKYIGVNR